MADTCQKTKSKVFGAKPAFQERISCPSRLIWIAVSSEQICSQSPLVRSIRCCTPTSCVWCTPHPQLHPICAEQELRGWTLRGRSPGWHHVSWRSSTSNSLCEGCFTACEALPVPGCLWTPHGNQHPAQTSSLSIKQSSF